MPAPFDGGGGGAGRRRSPSQTAAARAFLRACELDVLVRKPGNVSLASPGHGMDAPMFIASAAAASEPLLEPGRRVGARIEHAVAASLAVAGCNTNLGILLLAAPIAAATPAALVDSPGVALSAAAEPPGAGKAPPARSTGAAKAGAAATSSLGAHGTASIIDATAAWPARLEAVFASLDRDDAAAAFRAIARAHPGGLGEAAEQDVHAPPTVTLREAMTLAAERDRIARQYRDGGRELFEIGLVSLGPIELGAPGGLAAEARPGPALTAAVQRVYLAWLATVPDSHIVRKRGEAMGHHVLTEAAAWHRRAEAGALLDDDPAFAAWDESLKQRGLNPGTTADLTVATLFLAGLVHADAAAGT